MAMRFEVGANPWEPNPDAVMVERIHHYDIPLQGIIRMNNGHWLFVCVSGEVEQKNVWAYTMVSPGEAVALCEDPSPGRVKSYIERAETFLLATDDDGIIGEISAQDALSRDPNVRGISIEMH